jgi:phospholipase D1/2
MYDQKKATKDYPPYSRLKDILFQCAKRGVKVYILIYAETSFALPLSSEHTQKELEPLHPNIQVERHPLGFSLNPDKFMWSHHEKLVIIDQIIGYVGGLDLCWGRWDTHAHPIYEKANDEQEYYFPGIDYSNARLRDFKKVSEYLTESSNRATELRMPWHDVHSRLIGPVVADLARHFVERWNYSRFGARQGITDIKQNASVSKDMSQLMEANTIEENEGKKEGKKGDSKLIKGWINESNKKNENSEDSKIEPLIPENENEISDKKIDTNTNINNDNTEENQGMKKKGSTKLRGKRKLKKLQDDKPKDDDKTQKEGYLEEILLRERYMKNKIVIDKDHIYLIKGQTKKLRGKRLNDLINKVSYIRQEDALNKNEADINDNSDLINEEEEGNIIEMEENKGGVYNKYVKGIAKVGANQNNGWINNILNRFRNSEEPKLENSIVNVNFFKKGIKSKVQVLRSGCDWSVGVKKKENSILQAYYQLIDNSKHYLYIENQFFVSKSYNEEEGKECEIKLPPVVENMIAYHIRKRIERAYKKNEKFRVFVFIPLLPGFEGEPQPGTLQLILKHTYAGICRNHGMSIIEQLEKIMGDKWKDYIGFYSLRGHDLVNNVPATELIYIHSKLMIVDDTEVILGSANINDRSMLGNRDSEYAVIIKERTNLKSKMNGEEYNAANFAHSFRVNLFAEHLGLDSKDKILEDPLSDEFLELLQNTARKNTEIYRELWGCYPDDEYKSITELKAHKNPTTKEELDQLRIKYEKEKKGIIGHAVEFPLHFLENDNLGVDFFSAENCLPEILFT